MENVFPYGNTNFSITSSEALNWFGSTDESSPYFNAGKNQIYSASRYDENNQDYLYYLIPPFITNNSNNDHPYSYTTYKKKSKPELNIKDLWHPYLIEDNVVKNSIIMKNNLLITGPNAAGKSTFIKSVIINILLSQTIGINSCSLFEITPFHLIETYLHIPDVKGKSSLFEAEMFRSKEYIEKLHCFQKVIA